MINYDDFLDYCRTLPDFEEDDPSIESWHFRSQKKYKERIKVPCFYKKAMTSYTGGGSCWNENDEHYTEYYNITSEDLEITAIDQILLKYKPDITFLQHKMFIKKLNIEDDSYTQNEYYGNSTHYSVRKLTIEYLYNVLIEQGILQ